MPDPVPDGWTDATRPAAAGARRRLTGRRVLRDAGTRRRPLRARRVRPANPGIVPAAYLVGGIPFTNIAARRLHGVDLREVGNGTVSGSGLYRVAGFGALAVFGLCDVAKGSAGPLLAGSRPPSSNPRPALAALAGAAAVAGHNWSPYLRGAGGRGISPAIGALTVTAPTGAAVLLAGLGIGRLVGHTALGALASDVVLIPACRAAHGRAGASAAAAVLLPILVKRLHGNGGSARGPGTYWWRLLLDRDTRDA